MNASFGQILGYIAVAVAGLSVFIEFVPIKINPISALLNWIGERTNKGLIKRVDALEKRVEDIADGQKDIDERLKEKDAINCRIRILRFSDELRCGVKHSRESFEQSLDDCDVYEKYCQDHPKFKNNKTVVAQSRIIAAYQECLGKDNFL